MEKNEYAQMMEDPDTKNAWFPEGRKIWFIEMVQERLCNCKIYFGFPDETTSTFVSEVIAIATVGTRSYAATFRTSHISLGISKQNMEREADILSRGLSATLADKIFIDGTNPILEETLVLYKEVNR